MKDLISREALLKNAQRMTEYDEAGWGVPVRVVKVEHIETAPAVDAVEVVHGRWENVQNKPFMIYACSQCGEKFSYGMVLYCHYCPNCGADRRERKE